MVDTTFVGVLEADRAWLTILCSSYNIISYYVVKVIRGVNTSCNIWSSHGRKAVPRAENKCPHDRGLETLQSTTVVAAAMTNHHGKPLPEEAPAGSSGTTGVVTCGPGSAVGLKVLAMVGHEVG